MSAAHFGVLGPTATYELFSYYRPQLESSARYFGIKINRPVLSAHCEIHGLETKNFAINAAFSRAATLRLQSEIARAAGLCSKWSITGTCRSSSSIVTIIVPFAGGV
jgi:hypothetical protein